MNRPEHLSCVNTATGISRINQEQELYDSNPQAYEHQQEQERMEMEQREREEQFEFERQQIEQQEYEESGHYQDELWQ